MKKYSKVFSYTLVCLLVIVAVFSTAVIISPAAAMILAPDLPVVKEIIRLENENRVLKDKVEYNSEVIEKYKHTITEEDRNLVGNVVLEFVTAQYSNDREKMYSLCSDEFREALEKDPLLAQAYGDDVELRLVIVNNIVKQDDKYMAFIRLEDSRADSQYQENFYLQKSGNNFFITMVEQDV